MLIVRQQNILFMFYNLSCFTLNTILEQSVQMMEQLISYSCYQLPDKV